MKNSKLNKILLIFCILFFFFSSIISIYSSSSILNSYYSNLYYKQLIWYLVAIIIFIISSLIGNDRILRYSTYFYIASIILLIIVLIFGNEVNNTRGWISLGNVNFQPSEFAKVGLIFYISKILNDYHFEDKKNFKSEFFLIMRIILITFIPSILVFVEPDTGAVISYLIIAISMLFISEIKFRWLLIGTLILFLFLGAFIITYSYYPNLFVNIFGDAFYYRIFRIIDWTSSSGMQLENSLVTIGTSGLFGHGINNIPLYFPEPFTDFIFPVFVSNFGLIGAIALLFTIIAFDLAIIKIAWKSSRTINKYIIVGILTSFIFPQIQNIAMTIGILPIMGIVLPFISYGGSSLIISFFLLAIIFNNESHIFKKKKF